MNYTVSVVIPVYNRVQFIERAVESVLKQKNSESFQIILVDDGSTDGVEKLCDELQEKYRNVFTFHQENAGVSAARNLGIEKSEGEWISFIDCDDYLLDGFYEKLFDGETADLLCCDFLFEKSQFPLIGERIAEGIYYKKDFGKVLYPVMAEQTVFYSACNKVFKAEIIKNNNVKFPVGMKFAEDMTFVYEYVKHIDSFKFVNEKLYYYYMNESSASLVVSKSFETFKSTYIIKAEFFKAVNADSEIYDKLQLNYLMDSVSSIVVAVESLGFFEALQYIKSIVNDKLFIENYTERPVCSKAQGIIKLLDKHILKKHALIILLLVKFNDLRIKFISK